MQIHKFDEFNKCKACCCGPTECPKCDKMAHSLSVVDEVSCGDDYRWVHSYKCPWCGEEFQE